MKTKYFKSVALGEDVKKDINKLAAMPKDILEQILIWIGNKKTYPRFDKNEIIEVAQITKQSGENVKIVLSILKLFIDRIIENDDNVSDFYSDIKTLGIVEAKIGYDSLDVVFSLLQDLTTTFRAFHKKKKAEERGGPVLVGSSMTVAIKPIFPREFEYGKDSITEYEPSPMDYCVVGQIELAKSDSEEFFSFQLNRDNLDRFVTDLLALQAEMLQVEKEAAKITPSSQIGK